MTATTNNCEKQEHKSTWQMLLSADKNWLNSLCSQSGEETDVDIEDPSETDEASADQLVDFFLSSLAPLRERVIAQERDFEIMKRACASLIEAKEENILTENEAGVLLEFLVSKFIERRFDIILRNVFDAEASRKYFFRAIKGSMK